MARPYTEERYTEPVVDRLDECSVVPRELPTLGIVSTEDPPRGVDGSDDRMIPLRTS